MKKTRNIETPPPEENGPNNTWEEETPPKKEPYEFNQRIEGVDIGRLVLCPECGNRCKGKRPNFGDKWGEMRFACSKDPNHRWVFDSKTNTVEDLNKRLEFPGQ